MRFRPLLQPFAAVMGKTIQPIGAIVNTNTRSVATTARREQVLNGENINPHVAKMEYAVRGPIVTRAGEIEEELKKGATKPFDQVVRCNIGDCHATGQHPVKFLRQVLALCIHPELLESCDFPDDAKSRAEAILGSCRGSSMGSYTDSVGLAVVREHIANYIEERDGHPSDTNNLFLCTGATEGIKAVLRLLQTGKDAPDQAGVMIPIPQYPLYSATLTEFNATQVPYYLNEENGWSLDVDELQRSIAAVKGQCKPRAIVVINPGNPTGQVLPKDNIRSILEFAHREKLVVLADEVYQHNVYAAGSKFHSFKKVLMEMGAEYNTLELASFMSVSKGWMGECGLRGGYAEIVNFHPDAKAMLYKSLTASLCSSSVGQAAMDVVINPPKPGEPSFVSFNIERNQVLTDLKTKAALVTKTFNSIEGIRCNEVQGAMYAFPQIQLPQKAIDAAKAKKMTPDGFYCWEMLEETGICVVAGAGFGQKPGTFHFRTTILPPVAELTASMEKFKAFHLSFLQRYK